MTKSWEKGDNEILREARRESARTGRPVADILAEWLRQAKAAKDIERQRKIVQAQKFHRSRNRRKRKRGS
jgi:hypothetical protein